jgi:proteasome lid subunit RPN8/RPN11
VAQTVINHKQGDKRRRFEIEPVDYMRAERFADENGFQLLGVYHSHPLHPAVPSEHDRIAAVPFFSYIITSVFPDQEQVIRSWRLNESEQFEEEEII